MDQRRTVGVEHRPAMSVNRAIAIGLVLRATRRKRSESRTDEAAGRAVHANAFLRCAEDDRGTPRARLRHQSETSAATTAADRTGSDLSEATTIEACAWPSDLSLPAAERCDYATESSMVERYHVYSPARGFHLSGRRYGLVQPLRAQLGNLNEPGFGILLLGVRPRTAPRPAGNLQHRPGGAIHQRRIHQPARRREYPHQHGRSRPSLRQRLRRAPVAIGQIRRCLPQGLQRSSRCRSQPWTILHVLQSRATASGIGLSNTRCRLSQPGDQDKEAASRQFLLMSFEGMRKSIRTMEAPTSKADAPAHLSDEFPTGYSLTRCSPAELVSASPAGVNDAVAQDQPRGFLNYDRSRTENLNRFHRQQSTLTSQFFCPKNGETLIVPLCAFVFPKTSS